MWRKNITRPNLRVLDGRDRLVSGWPIYLDFGNLDRLHLTLWYEIAAIPHLSKVELLLNPKHVRFIAERSAVPHSCLSECAGRLTVGYTRALAPFTFTFV